MPHPLRSRPPPRSELLSDGDHGPRPGRAEMSRLVIRVNGKRHVVKASPNTPLLYILRNELHLSGPRFGCGLAQCGACTVHLGGKAIRSCVTPALAAADK